jgi:HlyD family secretion protein
MDAMRTPSKRWLIAATVALLVAIGLAAGWLLLRQPPLPEGLIQANGRIEGDHYLVAGKMPGRVAELFAREGDAVQKDQVLLRLDAAQVDAKVEQAHQAVVALEAQFKAAQTGLAMLRKDAPLTVQTAEAGEALARSQRATALANAAQAARDAARFKRLVESGTVDRHRYEQMELASQVAQNQANAARHGVTRAAKQLAQARLGLDRIRAREDEVAALAAQRDQAKAALAEARSMRDDLTLKAPAAGVLTTRLVDVGEVIAPGASTFDVVDLDRLYLKVFIPANEIGKLRLGLPARIYTDAFPNEPLTATVRHIAAQAQFTPKEVQTPDERVKLVYAVKLYLDANPQHRATPGLPADAVIRWEEGAPWTRPRW